MRRLWQSGLDVDTMRRGATALSGNGPAKLILDDVMGVLRGMYRSCCASATFPMLSSKEKLLEMRTHGPMTSLPSPHVSSIFDSNPEATQLELCNNLQSNSLIHYSLVSTAYFSQLFLLNGAWFCTW
jgi:hypothetical protein